MVKIMGDTYQHSVDGISNGAIVQIRDQLMAAQKSGKKVFRLESGDPSFDVPLSVKTAINQALTDNKTHYTEAAGIPELRKQLASKLLTQNHILADMQDIVVTNGAMHALYLTFRCLLDPGDEVIIPNPMWTEIAEHIKLAGGIPVYAPVAYTAEDLKSRITQRTKAIFINSPHNPTGHIIPQDELFLIANLAEANKIKIISDEAYEHVLFDERKHSSIGKHTYAGLTISIFSASKSYAMSGLRIGYIHSENRQFMERVKKLLRCSINGVNSATQYGLLAALSDPNIKEIQSDMNSVYETRREILKNEFDHWSDIETKNPAGSFFLWAKVKENKHFKDGSALSLMLLERGIGNVPGAAFGPNNEAYIRFSFSGKTTMIREAAEALQEFRISLK